MLVSLKRGVSYQRLLEIATEVCGFVVKDLAEVRTRGEFERIHMRLREEKRKCV